MRNTSVRLCGDIPVCQPRPGCETPALRARLTDERPAGRSPGSQVSWRNISQVHADVLVCVSSDAVELETLLKLERETTSSSVSRTEIFAAVFKEI